jgi:predicted enzyme related to lactoylglutathione lyase
MPTITQHAPGTFCWPELATTDARSAVAFYTKLFDWTVNESPMSEGSYYMFQRNGRDASAMMSITAEMRAHGVPPNWGAYVSVENVDKAVKQVEAAGGRVLKAPFDVMEHGRMAVVMDPLGATFSMWQGRSHSGVGIVGEPGSLGWTQLNARDPGKAKAFYPAVFGWQFRDMPMGPGTTYTTWLLGETPAGGMMPMPPDVPAAAPSHWLTYFVVANIRDGHAKAVSLGAKEFVPPSDIPGGGSFSVLADPQGAAFGLMTTM